ncbi:MAG: hypothetical protein EOP42_03615 [Sphingobacteriaceae bacterium]|nr:MAG: hypothetical protein EOP42_03615 [Sphingobacteriaceae bacterium]
MKFLFALLLFFVFVDARAQQLAQYNTATLFDSFENPAQRAFIPDSSRQFAFNFFIPNTGTNSIFTGNGRQSLLSLINHGTYNSSNLTNGFAKQNTIRLNTNTYWFMLKVYTRLDGDQEWGISAQTKASGHGNFTDETLLLLDSYKNFDNGSSNNNLFNGRLNAEAFHQFSLSFRKKISPEIAFGVKLSALLGIYYNQFSINNSAFYVDKNSTAANLFLQGNYTTTNLDHFAKRDLLGLKNPGAAVTFGMQAQLENGFLVQGNVKDLGFIRWHGTSVIDFNGTETIDRITRTRNNADRILTEVDSLVAQNASLQAVYKAIDARADLSISKKYNLAFPDLYVTPTLLVSKNLFYNRLDAAFINHFNYKSLWFTALASYNNADVWNFGTQLMIKSPNAEFFIGTEQLSRSAKFFDENNTSYRSGINAFVGFSAKFGRLVEHPANASYIPMGNERGFFNRLWLGIFKRSY